MSLPSPDARLAQFRERMEHYKVDAFIQTTSDAHQSEYVNDRDKRLGFLSMFNGSAGTIVVTANEARLWTDGRYFNQAGKQLSNDWTLMKQGLPDTPTVTKYISNLIQTSKDSLKYNGTISLDGRLNSVQFCNNLNKEIIKQGGSELLCLESNPIDEVWGEHQPIMPDDAIFIHDLKYCGISALDKIKNIQNKINNEIDCYALVVTALDHVAWLLNLRGNDIIYNPVFFSYLIITRDACHLYIDNKKLKGVDKTAQGCKLWENDEKELEEHLNNGGIIKHEYNDFFNDLKNMVNVCEGLNKNNKFWIDPNRCSYAIAKCIPDKLKIEKDDPIELEKSIKNDNEINGMKECHIRDGVAKTRFFAWIEEMKQKDIKLLEQQTEWSFAEKLRQFRAEQELFVDLSFETISSISSNGAVIHYSPSAEECSPIECNEMYLLDSGGQYLDGTTDVTRTTFLGDIEALNNYKSPKIKEYFTRVLKGVIALSTLIFPENSKGPLIDAIARQYLWQIGLDFRHGTGHGVGCFLNVHEGPIGFSASTYRRKLYNYGLKENMVITNEPGYYRDGEFGIRIENVMIVKEYNTEEKMDNNSKSLTFETITMVPIDKRLMLLDIMTVDEIKWVNDYHQIVLNNLLPYMTTDFEKEFLKNQCSPLPDTVDIM